ncbi:MAG: lysine--tRNA ligase [Magnetospiraceae bacterium]
MSDLKEFAQHSNAWPFAEARELLKRVKGRTAAEGPVLFETGYGPSGLPHIGTFGEVARTTMVRQAFALLSDLPTRLVAFSDDMDGLRKVPDNVPNKDLLAAHLGKPLTAVPDPFGDYPSFGEHNNARLQAFLDRFGFDYEFKSATQAYRSGEFDAVLLRVLEQYHKVLNVVLPTLGAERQATYSPFLPVCEKTGRVLQVPVTETKSDAGTIVYKDEDGSLVETPVTGGHCKLQWKVDWAMRWTALAVDYEMSGKDLIESVKLSTKICRILGGNPPIGFTYELFLDEKGEKISKSKGNGLTMEEWLRYAPPESLSLFMFGKPKAAKKLYFDVIPKNVDEYVAHLAAFQTQEGKKLLDNPVWHIHGGNPPPPPEKLSFNILLNLASVCNSEDKSVLWHFIDRYRPGLTPENAPLIDALVGYAINYYRDFVKPKKQYRAATAAEKEALNDLVGRLAAVPDDAATAEAYQTEVYEAGKAAGYESLRDWFKALYQILLGQDEGPRMGSFIALYGRVETADLINRVIAGEDLAG